MKTTVKKKKLVVKRKTKAIKKLTARKDIPPTLAKVQAFKKQQRAEKKKKREEREEKKKAVTSNKICAGCGKHIQIGQDCLLLFSGQVLGSGMWDCSFLNPVKVFHGWSCTRKEE